MPRGVFPLIQAIFWSALLATALAPAATKPEAGWQARAVVQIPKPLPNAGAGLDTAAVRILCQGRGKPDGSDYRVRDESGKPLPFALVFHDPARSSLIAFRCADPKGRYYVDFGNPRAERAPEQIAIDSRPGAGPPKGEWVPRQGLVLQTIARPKGENPKTVEELKALIDGSSDKYGARYQRKISDGYNPFGPSDNYISLYRGWIEVPKAGTYQFCTASNEASFSFLDGKTLVHWPGRHTVERGLRGEKHAAVELAAGPHYVEYYQEEVTLEQMAFLGWRPSADEGPFSEIPESVYTAPHTAVVTALEGPEGPLASFEPEIIDSIWPVERHRGQYTRARFHASAPAPPRGTAYAWDFGDGQVGEGAEVEHVYLALGKYGVTLTAKGGPEIAPAKWPLEVFEIEHVTDQFPEGDLAADLKLVKSYDRPRLDAANLAELAFLLSEGDDFAGAAEAGQEFVKRFGDSDPKTASTVRRLMADCALRSGGGGIDEAIANYRASITAETPPAERLDVLARLIRLLGIEANQPEKAGAVVAEVEESMKGVKLDDETRAAYRRAVIAAGDVLLWQAKPDGARDLYKRAETLAGKFIPSSVRAARIGAFPDAIREALAAGNPGAAIDVVDRWEETFPTEKPAGTTFFWRGKLLSLRGQDRDSARYLARAIGLAVGAAFETEARSLLARSLDRLGRPDDARKERAKLIATGLDDEFVKKAREEWKAAKSK